ncbi:MAG: MerR family transcriptional regulator [Eggerthellaceae bacterium]|nr:MerR family transcriptional regulator [Eggerthellaceae bacterium]
MTYDINSSGTDNDFGDASNARFATGELAELCGTTVRTVQYYDNKGLLNPSGYSDGGRRLYSEGDAARLRFILMMKSLGLKLAQIRGVLESPNREKILDELLGEQAAQLEGQIAEAKDRLAAVKELRAEIRLSGRVLTTTNEAMADRMEDRLALRRARVRMVCVGVLMDVLWIGTLVLGAVTGVWWPFPLALAAVACLGFWLVADYNVHATFLCPACGAEFRPSLGAFFVSGHTSKTRKLACPRCGVKEWCVERYHAGRLAVSAGECVSEAQQSKGQGVENGAGVGGVRGIESGAENNADVKGGGAL